MNSLIEVGLINAALATILGVVMILVGKVARRPALVHALWVLVLLKLITPPCIDIPMGRAAPFTLAPQTADSPIPLAAEFHLRAWCQAALGIWLTGALVWFVLQGVRIARFRRYLKCAEPAPASVRAQTDELARALGLRRVPDVLLVPGPVSPMLWSLGWGAKLLFPAQLLERLDDESRATLLTHELAHYRRGDHWVRLLELVVTGLYWWHPIVWWGRREIEIAEEECCDAWVVGQFPQAPRRYAEALLETIDFLALTQPQLPPVASGIGDVPLLRKRLTQIMRGAAPKTMSHLGRLAVLLSVVLLPLHPTWTDPSTQRSEAALAQTRRTELWVDVPADSPSQLPSLPSEPAE